MSRELSRDRVTFLAWLIGYRLHGIDKMLGLKSWRGEVRKSIHRYYPIPAPEPVPVIPNRKDRRKQAALVRTHKGKVGVPSPQE